MSAEVSVFSQEEMAIDEAQGFPKAYARLCSTFVTNGPLANGHLPSFIPHALQSQEALKVKELNRMFPVIDQELRPSANLRCYADFLWTQLDHLGNAGFDPALFRVDRFGNVVYRHADSSSPLAWDIDHWFPISRGGKTVPSNLRIVQWQVCKKKKNNLDFLIPWWDLQLGISVNQFLSIFASRNSDFRSRAFSFFFQDGGEGLECLQNFYLHGFPQKFLDAKRKHGLAPAAIVSSQKSSETMVLKTVNLNRPLRHNHPFPESTKSFQKKEVAANIEPQGFRSSISKENNQSALDGHKNSPCLKSECRRDSLRQRKDARKQQEEMSRLDGELNKLRQQNDIEQIALLDLEAELRTRRKGVEKYRRLSDAQASYRSLLEKMIRDAMHQTIVYIEQFRLNEAASSTLLARLEAERSACDSSESKLCEKSKQREDLEIHALVYSEQASKKTQIYDDFHENSHDISLKRRVKSPIKKELREFLEEEKMAFKNGISLSFDGQKNSKDESKDITSIIVGEEGHYQSNKVHEMKDAIPHNSSSLLVSKGHDMTVNDKLRQSQHSKLNVVMPNVEQRKVSNKQKKVQKSRLDAISTNDSRRQWNLQLSSHERPEETEEYRILVGKDNVEKWLQFLPENAKEGSPYLDSHPTPRNFGENSNNVNIEVKQNEIELCTIKNGREKSFSNKDFREKRFKEKSKVGTSGSAWKFVSRGKKSFDVEDKEESKIGLPVCESSSSRGFISLLSSLRILGMRKSIDCLWRKPRFINDDKK